ncbi:SulP family inorganic anion transporter [Cryomorpha ignava]|uniref:SulP family inorganic anion transporter n=1 Tax=Cryomorpha ignava TaxID=101383 RepID=A0A7K3WKN3_9FLAO|nr:SulP family inorganic anion transporter [Cryomorpha ignava]NEN22206.1 SulP family inorganic anion transporter [Cryomorpha ignava]
MNKSFTNLFSHFRTDFMSSIVVFLVALPLCLGIALASGVPLLSGIIAGIIGGIVIGTASKSHLSVSGPAAGLVVIVLNAIEDLGSFESFLLAVMIAGVLQIILGYAKAGVIGMYFPSSVIKGMLAAIGLILILKQIPHLVGFDSDAFGEMEFFQQGGSNTFSALFDAFTHVQMGSLIIGFLSMGILILWSKKSIQNIKALKQLPGGVVVVFLAVFVNYLFIQFAPEIAIDASHLVSLPVFSDFESFTSTMALPSFDAIGNPTLYITAITIAIVASLETLLSTEAIDRIDPEKRRTPQNAELKAQGLGNLLSGAIGGLPITAVIVRSSTNLASGAKTKLSAILHGFWLLIAVALLPTIMNLIPLAALAAILIMVGYKLTNPALYKAQFKVGRKQFIPFIVTVIAILFTDLLIGILVGMAVGVFYILRANYQVPYKYYDSTNRAGSSPEILIELSEHVSFLNKANLRNTLEHIPDNSHVILDGSKASLIDHDVLELIHDFKFTAHEKNIKAELKHIPRL